MPDNIENPSPVFAVQRKIYNESVGRYIRETNTLRLVCFGLALSNVAVGAECVWQASQSHVEVYVIEKNKLGESVTAQRLLASSAFDPTRVRPQLHQFIRDLRTISSDTQSMYERYNQTYAWIDSTSPAKIGLDGYYAANPPAERAKGESVVVSVEGSYLQGGNTWVVNWNETSTKPNALRGAMTHWRMEIRIKQGLSKDQDVVDNPGMFLIQSFTLPEKRPS